ncbi:MAG: glutamate formimidoyltransferase [Thermoleophilia bacterium]
MPPLESVPNFSESRDRAVVAALRAAVEAHVPVLDVHVDDDHDRSVLTFAGPDDAVVDALVAAVRVAVERIDLRGHDGVHPCIGAADVLPLVPLADEDEPRARAAALALADRLADELGLPVFLYGLLDPERRGPAYFRRGGAAGLAARVAAGELAPFRGPQTLHPTAGAALVGVRRPLVAFNVNLSSRDLDLAREIAGLIRERDGGLPGVRALGLPLERAGLVQVSMNLEDWRATPPHVVVERIAELAAARGIELAGSELVGLLPAGAAALAARRALGLPELDASRLLESAIVAAT